MYNKPDLVAHVDNKGMKKLRVINIGLLQFYDALVVQNVHAIHLEWQPPPEHSQEMNDLLDKFL